jgi:hypothetical protein
VDPSSATFVVAVTAGNPADFCCDAAAFGKGGCQFVPYAGGATDSFQEGGLKNSWDTKRGRREENAERRVRSHE